MEELAELGLGSIVVGSVAQYLGVGMLTIAGVASMPLVPVGIGLLIVGAYNSIKQNSADTQAASK